MKKAHLEFIYRYHGSLMELIYRFHDIPIAILASPFSQLSRLNLHFSPMFDGWCSPCFPWYLQMRYRWFLFMKHTCNHGDNTFMECKYYIYIVYLYIVYMYIRILYIYIYILYIYIYSICIYDTYVYIYILCTWLLLLPATFYTPHHGTSEVNGPGQTPSLVV